MKKGKRQSYFEDEADESEQRTPPKNARTSDEKQQQQNITTPQSQQQTPASPSRFMYQMSTLDAALAHYFSPKKKSPGRAAGKSAQRKLQFTGNDFETEEENDGEDAENAEEGTKQQKETKKALIKNVVGSLDCDISAVRQCFDQLDNFLPKSLQFDEKQQDNIFEGWFNLLSCKEFNILVHGFGSKRKLFERFRNFLSNQLCFLVEGTHNAMSVQVLFEQIEQNLKIFVRPSLKRKSRLNEWAKALSQAIDKALEKEDQLLFLLINNIDSQQLRPRAQQEALSILVRRQQKIRLVAGVDHVNAALVWDQKMRDDFNWLYFPISTWNCYGQEVLNGPPGSILDFGRSSKTGFGRSHTIESLDVFWQATTSNMRKILEQLALHAPAASAEKFKRDPLGIPKFCRILKEEFATTSETVLRQQLIEFRDHSIINLNKEEQIQLLVDRNLLVAFLEQKMSSSE